MEGVGAGRARDRLDTSSADGGSGRDDGGLWLCGSAGRSSYAEDSGMYAEGSICREVDACYWITRMDGRLVAMGMVVKGKVSI